MHKIAHTVMHATLRPTVRNLAVVALLSLPTCNPQDPASSPGRSPELKALGKVPATETVRWQKVTSVTAPEGRFLQAVAFDESRQLVVMFGGENRPLSGGTTEPTQDMWEWSPTTHAWAMRAAAGTVPDARAGAAMVFDPVRNKMMLFGGRSVSGYNYEDLWEWDPTTGAWAERGGSGSHPSARAQHGMLYLKSTGKILLFGGGRSNAGTGDGTSISASLGDSWELDPSTATWTLLSPTSSPGVRHDFGLVWDGVKNKAVLFGGMQVDIPGASGVPKQDTWEWDPSAHTWTDRTAAGDKPGQRYGHAMAFDAGNGSNGKVVLFGGWDMASAGSKNDLWAWDSATGSWAQLLTGAESGIPAARTYASMVYDSTHSRLVIIAGQIVYSPSGSSGYYGLFGSNEVWELNSASLVFTDRSTDYQVPPARAYHAVVYNPATGKVYLFGGVNPMFKGDELADLWEWDGAKWNKVVSDLSPPGRVDGAMAYDPARQSLILFGGRSWMTGSFPANAWEWSGATRKWTQLPTNGGPAPRSGHAMVTDTARKKILMFGGSTGNSVPLDEIWEWDGATLAWTNRTPAISGLVPKGRTYPVMSFDDDRGKLVLYDGSQWALETSESNTAFWEWDTVTGGWALRDPNDSLPGAADVYAVYDSTRRRHVFFNSAPNSSPLQPWELDAKSATWYVRSLSSTPADRINSAAAYDSGRRVAVLFGGILNAAPGGAGDDTWEYAVSNLANGEGCTAASAASCASGNCVDGVCCESATCSGACKSCNVPGSEGSCVLAQAGTEVPGSCSNGQACDGAGNCKSKNGQACSAASSCASGFCVDGVCCDLACNGTCMACNLAGRAGKCTAHAAGTDPDGECGQQGTGICKTTCDGVSACAFPTFSCGTCLICDTGTCSQPDPVCVTSTGGVPGKGGGGSNGSGGKIYPGTGGIGGYPGQGGATGGSSGSGGTVTSRTGGVSGGSGGVATSGAGGMTGGSGGATRLGAGGTIGSSGGMTGSGAGGIVAGTGGLPWDGGSSGGGASGQAGGSGGTLPDASAAKVDGSGQEADGSLVASLHRSGCSCATGTSSGVPSSDTSALSWMLLVGAAVLVRRRLRSRPAAK